MPKINVRMYGTIRDIADPPRAELALAAGATVRDMLNGLAERFGPRLTERLLTAEGRLQSYVRLFVGENDIDSSDLDRPIAQNGDSATEVSVYIVMVQMGG